MSFEQLWRDLLPVGRSAATGGYFRQPFLAAEREAAAWFAEAASAQGLVLETDAFGNVVAWWDPVPVVPDARGALAAEGERPASGREGAVLTGSHLDSVLDGGAFDGPLGVVSALAAVDVLRDRGVTPRVPLGIGVFMEEEGSRFGLACLGSRLATGLLPWETARELRDRDGTALGDVVAGGASTLLDGVTCFVELHAEQGRDLVHRGAAVGLASAIWPHGRYRFDFCGHADHAGTTRMADRRDPMLTYAATALAAAEAARSGDGMGPGRVRRATFGRLEVRPNGTNAIPSQVSAWLDARASSEVELEALLGEVSAAASARAARDGTTVRLTAESASGEVLFDAALTRRLAEALSGVPVIPTGAGHDAGILQQAGIPAAMLFVRNETGVSHSPAEHLTIPDALVGVTALADVLESLIT
ncbi:allantoate amidohydrolase [Antribacter gilvus]|uniref:allantoate amidohydrolase n=1 Tax=Antribacter gilvus TaxID=2304675 RepID=UPI000F784111|nr:allantoate amidohydrolase [Antribacter gilvus]